MEQLKECKKITCTKLIPFKEKGRFYVRWEGEFIEEDSGLPMQLIIPKLSMDMLNLNTYSNFIFNRTAIARFEIKFIQEENQNTLFIIKTDKEG